MIIEPWFTQKISASFVKAENRRLARMFLPGCYVRSHRLFHKDRDNGNKYVFNDLTGRWEFWKAAPPEFYSEMEPYLNL